MITLEKVLLLQLENRLTTNNDWYRLSTHKLSEEVIRKYIDKLSIKKLCKYNVIPEDIMIKYVDDPIIMKHFIITQTLSDKMKLKILNYSLRYQNNLEDITIKEFKQAILYASTFNSHLNVITQRSYVYNIFIYQNLSDEFIKNNLQLVDFYLYDILFYNKKIPLLTRKKLLNMRNNNFKRHLEMHRSVHQLKRNIYNKII